MRFVTSRFTQASILVTIECGGNDNQVLRLVAVAGAFCEWGTGVALFTLADALPTVVYIIFLYHPAHVAVVWQLYCIGKAHPQSAPGEVGDGDLPGMHKVPRL